MVETPKVAFTLPDPMPSAEWLIRDARDRLAEGHTPEDIREQWAGAWAGATELLAPVALFAEWLGLDKQTIYVARTRHRVDGKLEWPDEEKTVYGRKMWRFATIALHRSEAPGRGANLTREARARERETCK